MQFLKVRVKKYACCSPWEFEKYSWFERMFGQRPLRDASAPHWRDGHPQTKPPSQLCQLLQVDEWPTVRVTSLDTSLDTPSHAPAPMTGDPVPGLRARHQHPSAMPHHLLGWHSHYPFHAASPNHHLLLWPKNLLPSCDRLNCVPPNPYVEALTTPPSDCDYTRGEGF